MAGARTAPSASHTGTARTVTATSPMGASATRVKIKHCSQQLGFCFKDNCETVKQDHIANQLGIMRICLKLTKSKVSTKITENIDFMECF